MASAGLITELPDCIDTSVEGGNIPSVTITLPTASLGRFYRPELDAVRFLAFLLVFFHHSLPFARDIRVDHLLGIFAPMFYAGVQACSFGVSLFFALSAYLICELLLRERQIVGTVSVKQFYIRRILRIWPLYYFALGVGLLLAILQGVHQNDIRGFGWFVIFLGAQHTGLYGFLNSPFAPLWSVSVEEQFYLVAPWITKFFNRRLLFGFCAFLVVVANSSLYRLGSVHASFARVWTDSFMQFECFAGGIVLCLILRHRLPKISITWRLSLIVACWALWMTACYGLHVGFIKAADNPGSWKLIWGYGLVAIGAVLFLFAFLGVDKKIIPSWIAYLGRISYGLYVYHELALYIVDHLSLHWLTLINNLVHPLRIIVIPMTTLVLPLGLTIAMAAISYRYLETPFLKMKARHSLTH